MSGIRWLTNLYDPRRADAKSLIITMTHEHPDEAWRHQQEWLEGKIIGRPKGTDHYTVEELEAMHSVGIYAQAREAHDERDD